MNIRKKVLTDQNNNPIAVQIPIEDWNKIEMLLQKKQTFKKVDIMKFAGTVNFPEDPLEFQKRIREE